jgi:hypothetical protein
VAKAKPATMSKEELAARREARRQERNELRKLAAGRTGRLPVNILLAILNVGDAVDDLGERK